MASIHCSACGEYLPLSRFTMRNQERIVEELTMAREVHSGCADAASQEAAVRERRWREGFLRNLYAGGRQPDRLAWSA
jgi:hypothetical protein